MKKDIYQAIYEYLKASTELKTIVGANIYPMFIPQYDKIPAVVYAPIQTSYDTALIADTGFARTTVQFSCHESTFGKVRKLSKVIKRLFQNYSGDMCGAEVQATFIKTDYILSGGNVNRFDAETSTAVLEFDIFYSEQEDG